MWSHELQIKWGLLGGTEWGIHQRTDHGLMKTFASLWGAATVGQLWGPQKHMWVWAGWHSRGASPGLSRCPANGS